MMDTPSSPSRFALEQELHHLQRLERDYAVRIGPAALRRNVLEGQLEHQRQLNAAQMSVLQERSAVARNDSTAVLAYVKQRQDERARLVVGMGVGGGDGVEGVGYAKVLDGSVHGGGGAAAATEGDSHNAGTMGGSGVVPPFPIYSPSRVPEVGGIDPTSTTAAGHHTPPPLAQQHHASGSGSSMHVRDIDWLYADAQLQAKEGLSLAKSSPSAAAALSRLSASYGYQHSHAVGGNANNVSTSTSTAHPSATSVSNVEAIRRIAALEAEVGSIVLEIGRKQSLAKGLRAAICAKEEAIRSSQLGGGPTDATTAGANSTTAGHITGNNPIGLNASHAERSGASINSIIAEQNSRTATSTAIQKSLLSRLETTKAQASVGAALYDHYNSTNAVGGVGGGGGSGATTSTLLGNTAATGAATVGGGVTLTAATAGSANPPLMVSTRLDASYLAELTATVVALEAEASLVTSAAVQSRDVEERIMRNERMIQRLRMQISDCRLGVWAGVGPDGDGFSGSGLAASVTGRVRSGAAAAGQQQNYNSLVESIASSSNLAWRDTIRSLYVSTVPITAMGSSSSASALPTMAMGGGHQSSGGDVDRTVTLILCDLEHLSQYLLASGGSLTEAAAAVAMGGGDGSTASSVSYRGRDDTPFIYLSIRHRVAYFNRRYEGMLLKGGCCVGGGGADGLSNASTTIAPATAQRTHRYETAACIPKLAEEVIGTSHVAAGAAKAQNGAAVSDGGAAAGDDSTEGRGLWGSIAEVPADAYGTCVVLLPSGAFGALTRRIRDVSADSSLRTIAVGTFGIRSSDVAVTNRSNAAGGTNTASPSSFSDPAFASIATEVSATGYLASQVLPFVAHLVSRELLPASYVEDTAVMVPRLLTIGHAAKGRANKSNETASFHQPTVRASAASILQHYGSSSSSSSTGGGGGEQQQLSLLMAAAQQSASDSTTLRALFSGGGGSGSPSRLSGGGGLSAANSNSNTNRRSYLIGSNNTVLYDTAEEGQGGMGGEHRQQRGGVEEEEEDAMASYQRAMVGRQKALDNMLLSSALSNNDRVQRASFAVPKDRSARGRAAVSALGHAAVGSFMRSGGNSSRHTATNNSISTATHSAHYTHTSVGTMEALVTAQLKEILKPMRVEDIMRDTML